MDQYLENTRSKPRSSFHDGRLPEITYYAEHGVTGGLMCEVCQAGGELLVPLAARAKPAAGWQAQRLEGQPLTLCQGHILIVANDAPRLRLCESSTAVPAGKRGPHLLDRTLGNDPTYENQAKTRLETRTELVSLGRREYANVFATML